MVFFSPSPVNTELAQSKLCCVHKTGGLNKYKMPPRMYSSSAK